MRVLYGSDSVKAYGELTWRHRDAAGEMMPPDAETFAAFSEMVQPMRGASKLGAVFFQFPPWYTYDPDCLDYFGTAREMLPHDTIAAEFRHRSWVEGANAEETKAALTDTRLAYCAVDEPQIGSGSVPPIVMLTGPSFSMVRFHGRNARTWYGKNLQSSRDRFDYLYTQAELEPWADRIQYMAEQLDNGQMHVVTNNNASSYSIVNALDLQTLLGQPTGKGETLPEGVRETLPERELHGGSAEEMGNTNAAP